MKRIKNVFGFFDTTFRLAPLFPVFILINSLAQSAFIIFNAYAPKLVIDGILEGHSIDHVLKIGVFIVLVDLAVGFFCKVIKRLLDVQQENAQEKYISYISAHTCKISYEYLEDPYYLDLKERGMFALSNQSSIPRLLQDFADIIQKIITLIGLIAIISQVGIYLLLILVGSIILGASTQLIVLKAQRKLFTRIIPINRRFEYYCSMPVDKKNGKDLRIYDGKNIIEDNLEEFCDKTFVEFQSGFRKFAIASGLSQIAGALQVFGTYLFLAYRVYKNNLGIGSFSLFLSSAASFVLTMQGIFQSLTDIGQVVGYLDPLFEFMDLKEEKSKGKEIHFEGTIDKIEFRNVSFQYPRMEQMVLDDISFVINKKEKISVVGLNGAGKTTLVKLICRLYTPKKGEILVNGININDYEINSYLKEVSAVFQDFKLFNYSILENITLLDGDVKRAKEILNEVGLKEYIDNLPNNINTALGKEFDENATELSGGQMQKIAIARAIYKDSSLMILDEPTSALDPISEADTYENFNEMVNGKTAIYISHRMSSSIFCDKILVINGGKVEDYDTHNNLMKKKDSMYCKLFNFQKNNYMLK